MTESHDVEKTFLKTYNLPLHVHCTAVIYLPKKLLILESVILRFSFKTVWLCAIKRIKCVITKIQIFYFILLPTKLNIGHFLISKQKQKHPENVTKIQICQSHKKLQNSVEVVQHANHFRQHFTAQ